MAFEADGKGYSGVGRGEDLIIGGATHEGLDLLMQGGTLEKALVVTADHYNSAPPFSNFFLPEQQEALLGDGFHLARAFVFGFYHKYLPTLLEEYEVLEVEEEINWLMAELENPIADKPWPAATKKYIVCMSRSDGVLRKRSNGRLWHVSHKTIDDLDDIGIQKLETDVQRFAECLAIQAKYREEPEGTLYNYFLKGIKREDSELKVKRPTSGLIRPYIMRRGANGIILPEMLSFVYDWEEVGPDERGTLQIKNRRLSKVWEKSSIYNEMDFDLYLQWLNDDIVPPKKDYLRRSIVGMIEEYFQQDKAYRWLIGAASDEAVWADDVHSVGQNALNDPSLTTLMDRSFRLSENQCFNWKKRCMFFPVCWRNVPLHAMKDEGHITEREPNHLQEWYEGV